MHFYDLYILENFWQSWSYSLDLETNKGYSFASKTKTERAKTKTKAENRLGEIKTSTKNDYAGLTLIYLIIGT